MLPRNPPRLTRVGFLWHGLPARDSQKHGLVAHATSLVALFFLLSLVVGSARADVAVPHSTIGDEPIRGMTEQAVPSASNSTAQPQGMDYPRVLGALGIVIGLILALRWCGKWIFPAASGRSGSRAVEVLSRAPLSPKRQVVLLRIGRRIVVVTESGSQMNTLCEITDPDEVSELAGQLKDVRSEPANRVFQTMFGRRRRDFEATPPAATDLPADLREAEADDNSVTSARDELSGLRERVRMIAEQFNG